MSRRDTGFKNMQRAAREVSRPPEASRPETGGTHDQGGVQDLYTDLSVCRVLGIRRRILEAARTKRSRGKDWDAIGNHAGMTFAWCNRKANEQGKTTKDLIGLVKVEQGDGIYSCKLYNTFPNRQRVAVELPNGNIELATVPDSTSMRLGELFDCKLDVDGNLRWDKNLNDMKY